MAVELDVSGNGAIDIDKGGTNATTAAGARIELGVDMMAATYDPTTVSGDAFAMDNMVEGAATKILTDVERAEIVTLDELNTANGFDLQTPLSIPDVTWSDVTRTVTAAVKSGETEFYYWVDGTKHTHTSSVVSSAISTGSSGTYYFYFDDSGAIQAIAEGSVSDDLFYKYAILSLVYWNDTDAVGKPYKEQHGHRMDSADHEMEHMTIGARYSSGFALTGLVDATTTFTGSESGVFYDEDIKHSVSAATTMPFLYRLGLEATPYWKWSTADNNVGFMNGGSVVVWNELTGGSWQLTPADTAHDYMLIFVVAEGAETGYDNFSKIIDQAGYSSRSNARDAIEGAKKKLILEGLPSPEMCFLGVYIVRKNGDLENLADGSVYLDLRGTSSRGSGGDSAASNLAADIVVDSSGFTTNLSATDTDVQTALGTIDLITASGSGITLVASDPASPATGDGWVNTTDNQLKFKSSTGTIIFEAFQYVAD